MPKLLTTPFAIDANPDMRTDIQNTTGASPNSATYSVGFPAVTMQPLSSGGLPPKGSDFNGIFYDITDNIVFQTQGNTYPYNAAYATSIGGYPLNARIALDNGDIVRSTIANNTNDPNTDMNGWVNFEYNQKRKSVHVIDLGMKMDGSDETDKLNEIIAALDNCCLIIGGGNLKLSKTNLYAARFPKNDQPCVPILDKTNFSIEIQKDCEISVDAHAQGVFELINCKNSHIFGLGKIKGAGNFPPLDGTSGRGEKGVTGGGYATSGFWGYYKNNSYNTTAFNNGGFGGAFPQWGGGTASTWGLWNGGYIGNQGYGVLIHDGCDGCSVYGGLDISGFNGGGVQIGWNGDYFPTNTNPLDSKNIAVYGIKIHDCYNAGTQKMAVDGLIEHNNTIYKIGHPNALATDSTIDPGYGTTAQATTYSIARNCEGYENVIFQCKRKGVDVHAGDIMNYHHNTVVDCWVGGLFSAYSGLDQPSTSVFYNDNILIRCGLSNNATAANLAAIYVESFTSTDGLLLNAEIKRNKLFNCGGNRGIIASYFGNGLDCSENEVFGVGADAIAAKRAFNFGDASAGGTTAKLRQLTADNNKVFANGQANLGIGVFSGSSLVQGVISNTKVYGVSSVGMSLGSTGADVDVLDNLVEMSQGTAYGIANVAGVLRNNKSILSGTAIRGNTVQAKNTAKSYPSEKIVLNVTFNGTANPAYTIRYGGDFIDTVVSDTFGLAINLKNLSTNNGTIVSLNETSSTKIAAAQTYVRSSGTTQVVVGFSNGSGTPITAQSLTSGGLQVIIDVV